MTDSNGIKPCLASTVAVFCAFGVPSVYVVFPKFHAEELTED